MQELINFITSGSTDFTPQTIVGLIVFTLIFDGIMALLSQIVSTTRRK